MDYNSKVYCHKTAIIDDYMLKGAKKYYCLIQTVCTRVSALLANPLRYVQNPNTSSVAKLGMIKR